MSYGDTPQTSSDDNDDDDYNPNQQKAGTFSEHNLDDNNNNNLNQGTPQTDSDEDDDINMNDDNNDNNNNDNDWIKINDGDGQIQKFEISPNDTLHDLKDMVNNDEVRMTKSHFFGLSSNDSHHKKFLQNEDELAMNYLHQTLSIEWDSFIITILDGMDLDLQLPVSSDWTIKRIIDEIDKLSKNNLLYLSYSGLELGNTTTLGSHNINKSGYTLISRINISIEDQTCGLITDVLIADFWDFDKVLTTYLKNERREFHQSASFYYSGNQINLNENVHDLQLTNRSKLIYKVEAYNVLIYDEELKVIQPNANNDQDINNDFNAYALSVFDYWTLSDVKKAYSKKTKKPFMEKEKLLSDERELEDNIPLFKLRIKDNEKLIIEREQKEAVVDYICCECGSNVKLRRYDAVQCRQCFHEAVFKNRTRRVCQYNCR